jgi:hypothetical protein
MPPDPKEPRMRMFCLGRRRRAFVATVSVLAALVAAIGSADVPNLGDLKSQLLAYHDFGAYERDLEAVDAQASSYLAERAHKVKKPALVLDIDETSLSNWEAIAANDFAYFNRTPCNLLPSGSCQPGEQSKPIPCDTLPKGPCGAEAYDKSLRATAIAPTLKLAWRASDAHVTIFFITGRPEHERSVTEENLKKVGFPPWERVYMRPEGMTTESAADYKAPVRQAIEDEGYTIVVNVGDQPSDLLGDHAERGFLLPNPFYRIP